DHVTFNSGASLTLSGGFSAPVTVPSGATLTVAAFTDPVATVVDWPVSGGSFVNSAISIAVAGEVDVQAGGFLSAGATNPNGRAGGSIVIENGGVGSANSYISGTGTVAAGGSDTKATVELGGSLTVSGAAATETSAWVYIGGTMTVAAGANAFFTSAQQG